MTGGGLRAPSVRTFARRAGRVTLTVMAVLLISVLVLVGIVLFMSPGTPKPFVGDSGTPEVTWTFVLEQMAPGVTRLLVRLRGGPGYRFHGLPRLLTRLAVRVVQFIMQLKQLLGIRRRTESTRADTLVSADRSPTVDRDAA